MTTPLDWPSTPVEGMLFPESAPRYQYLGGKWVGYTASVTVANIGAAPAAKGVTGGDAHDHSGGDGAQIDYSTLSGRPPLGTAAPKDAPATGDASATQVVLGSDSRLTDSRAPAAHDHAANKLAQSATHESADTDSATIAMHHTLGTGANQAAAGNDIRFPVWVTQAEYDALGSAPATDGKTYYITP